MLKCSGLHVFWFHTNVFTDSSWFALFPHRLRFSGWRRLRERTWCTDRENSLKPSLSDKTHSSKDVYISLGLITLIKFLFLMVFLLTVLEWWGTWWTSSSGGAVVSVSQWCWTGLSSIPWVSAETIPCSVALRLFDPQRSVAHSGRATSPVLEPLVWY